MPTLWEIANSEAQRQGVDPRLVAAVMHTESGGRAGARSSAGAYGPMQLMPGTAKDLGVDINDPADNIRGGVKYLAQMLQRFNGDQAKALAGYNAGPGAVQKYGGVPPFRETQEYVRKIGGLMGTPLAAQQEPPMPKHGLDIDPSWLEEASGPAASAPAQAAAAVRSGPAPAAIDPSWLEDTAAPAPAASKPATAPNDWKRRAADLLGQAMPVRIGTAKDDPTGERKVVASPLLGGLASGVASIPAMADRLGAAAARKIPTWAGGNPNAQPAFADELEGAIASRTAAPSNVVEAGIGKAGEFVGAGLGAGKVVGGAGRALQAAGARRVGGAIANASAPSVMNAAGAVGGGFAAEAADKTIGQSIESPVGRAAVGIGAGMLGGMPAAGLANRLTGPIRNAETAATLAAAREAGIPVQASDISPRMEALKRGMADKVPFGNLTAKGVPAKQVAGVQQELRSVAERYRPRDLDPGAGTSGADRYMARDLRTQYNEAKRATNDAYQAVADALEANPGMPPIQLPDSQRAAQELLKQYPKTFRDMTLSTDARRALKAIRSTEPKLLDKVTVGGVDVDLKANPQLRAMLEAQGVKTSTQPNLTLQEVRNLSSELWDAANQAGRGAYAGGGSQKQAGALKTLANAVGRDVDSYMAEAPSDVQSAYAAADQTFRTRVLPFRADPKVYKLVSSKTPKTDVDLEAQGLYGNLFNSSQSERSAMALELMSPKGKQAAAYQALKEAGEKGLNNTGPEGLKSAAALRSLDIEGNPALANIAQHYPELAAEADRLKGLLQVGRSASAALGRRGAATGIQNMPLITGTAMGTAGGALSAFTGNPAVGFGLAIGAPVAGANAFNALNRVGAEAVARGPGSLSQRATPGALQGLLETSEEPPRKKKKRNTK